MKTFDEHMTEESREYLQTLLREAGGNVSRAARLAGRHRTSFHKLLKRYGITRAAQHQGNWDRPIPGDLSEARP